jgi:TP901 family phage tail tape measure protein
MLKQGWMNVVRYVSSFVGFYEIVNAIRNGINVTREFDKALTEMRKVSDESVASLKNFQKESFNIADSVGTTAVQIQNSTADFMRLGESIEQAKESAKTANILLNVSEFESIEDATESLVAMSAAYSELEKQDIVDKLNEVGNNYSISSDGIATALQDSASALKTASNDMDEAIALVTAGNAVVQDPDSVGSGLRTIALRLTGTKAAKDELESLGEDTEGVATTVSKLRDTIMSATKVGANGFKGFDILDDNRNYKSTYEILKGISAIYEDIVETDKKNGTNNLNLLLETIAGEQFCLKFVETHIYRTHLIARIA